MLRDTIGRLIGAPLINAALWVVGMIRERSYADVEGRYFQYKGNPIDITDGESGERWLSVTHVRMSVAELPKFETLNRLYPQGVRSDGGRGGERIEARSLADLLAKAQNYSTRRFLLWVQREVIFPAERKESMRQVR
jgi:hypothetical protein